MRNSLQLERRFAQGLLAQIAGVVEGIGGLLQIFGCSMCEASPGCAISGLDQAISLWVLDMNAGAPLLAL